MPIKQLKKEFQTKVRQGKFTNKYGGINMIKSWNWIEKRVISEIIESVLVKEIEDEEEFQNISGFRAETCSVPVIFNQCCALQRERAKEIKREL